MADNPSARARYDGAFWRAHHEAWKRRDLNQREYCEAQGLSLKAFGNWRAKFKAEPQPPARKLLYRRGGANHTLSHAPSHSLIHATYPSFAPLPGPIIPPARAGHRRRFIEAGRSRILAEAAKPRASVSEAARRYGIARRVLCRWRQEQAAAASPGLRRCRDRRCVRRGGGGGAVTFLLPNVKVRLAYGYTDMRKGMDGLALLVQEVLQQDPFSGLLFVFRGRKANLIKIVFWDGTGLCLFTKRLEHGVFLWPSNIQPGRTLALTSAQLSGPLERIDWRSPERQWRPAVAG